MALSGAFKLFDADNDVVKNIKSTISSGIWSGGSGTLSAFYSQSAQSSSNGAYYYDIYKTSPATDSEAEIQFSITYGHVHGSGSLGTVGAATGNRATAAIHAQLVNLLLGPNVDKFTYAGDTSSVHFYAISLKRARMREKVDPYLTPLYDALNKMIPKDKLKKFLSQDVIEIAPPCALWNFNKFAILIFARPSP